MMTTCCPSGAMMSKTRTRRKQPSTAPGVTVSLFHGTCALLLGAVLSASAFAQEVWNPFSREPRDPIEQGRIDSANDPAEAINRDIFKANKLFDDIILKPFAGAYFE